jgi:hypothetical protein
VKRSYSGSVHQIRQSLVLECCQSLPCFVTHTPLLVPWPCFFARKGPVPVAPPTTAGTRCLEAAQTDSVGYWSMRVGYINHQTVPPARHNVLHSATSANNRQVQLCTVILQKHVQSGFVQPNQNEPPLHLQMLRASD